MFELLTGDFLFDPKNGDRYSKDEDHIAQMCELFGNFPKHVAHSGKYSGDIFNRKGELRHIHKLRFWKLEDVLVEKYHFSRKQAREIQDFMTPMLNVNPAKRYVPLIQCIRVRNAQFPMAWQFIVTVNIQSKTKNILATYQAVMLDTYINLGMLSINLVEIVQLARSSNGLAQNDYNRYRRFCTRKIHGIRQRLRKQSASSASTRHPAKPQDDHKANVPDIT